MQKVRRSLLIILLLLGLQALSYGGVFSISPWTSDADCGIDSAKIYTHAINNNGTDDGTVTVNGVEFDNVYNSGSEEEGWTLSGGLWASESSVNITGDSASLALDTRFHYYTSELVLYNLTPGKVYEFSFFSVAWEDGERAITLTEGGVAFDFNQDEYGNDNGIIISCIYIADEDGQLHIGTSNGFHIYAFANCEYNGDLPVQIITVSPEEFTGGNRVSVDSDIVWSEVFDGSLTNPQFDVYFDPNGLLVELMDPSTLVETSYSGFEYDPALDYGIEYFWKVVPYVGGEPNEVLATDMHSFMTEYEVENWSYSDWTDDSDILVSAGKTYTHKVNFNASESATTYINGVDFENDSDKGGSDWTIEGITNSATGSHQVGGDGGTMVSKMYYNYQQVESTLTLTGLTPGEEYLFTKYTRGWGTNPRKVNVTTSVDGRTTMIDQNAVGNELGRLYVYKYTAPESGELVVTFSPLSGDNWHHYGFSNEVYMPVYVNPLVLPEANISKDDELQWTVGGDSTGLTYNVVVATDEALSSIADQATGLSDMSFDADLSSDMVYYWQVEIVDDESVVYTSPVWSFITSPPVDAACVIEWKLDETGGTIAEQTGPTEDADGILEGFNDPAVSFVPGLKGNCLYFNGRDEYVDVSDAEPYMPTSDGNSFAVSGYIRTVKGYGPIFSMRNSDSEDPVIDITIGWEMEPRIMKAESVCW